MFCPKCGTPSKGKRFCTRCGLAQMLPRYQGTPRNAAAQTVVRTVSVAAHQTVTQKVAPVVLTTPQRNAAAAQTVRIKQSSVTVVPALARSRGKALDRSTHTIPAKTASQRRVSVLLAAAVMLLLAGGFGFQQYRQQPVAAQAVASLVAKPTVTPMASPTPVLAQRWTLIADQTSEVSAAENALAEPDQTAAVIASGGQLALELRAGSFFGNGPGADVQVHSAALAPVSYTVFVRNAAAAAWQRIDSNRHGFVQGIKGHDMGHHGLLQARQLLIRNDADTALPVDAVSVVYPDKVVETPDHHHTH
ncbi:MAG: zinc ribbon domain-containing protein [Acidobacteria bacterium]|nr:zinc ribbon domain-containing protein [Acidobacteriota bacterium]MBI3423918.1 zinc ribbon domain-containing protein [Acidobacteriota bacterium]